MKQEDITRALNELGITPLNYRQFMLEVKDLMLKGRIKIKSIKKDGSDFEQLFRKSGRLLKKSPEYDELYARKDDIYQALMPCYSFVSLQIDKVLEEKAGKEATRLIECGTGPGIMLRLYAVLY